MHLGMKKSRSDHTIQSGHTGYWYSAQISNRLERNEREEVTFFFFLQLILLICQAKMTGIDGDKQIMQNYQKNERWNNLYAFHIDLGGIYRHDFKTINFTKIVRHGECIVCDSVRGGSSSIVNIKWRICADHDNYISTCRPFRC